MGEGHRAVTLERREKQVFSFRTGQHMPNPYESVDEAGLSVWRCLDCGRKLRRYFYTTRSEWRLRH
jgi:hypothetical protein